MLRIKEYKKKGCSYHQLSNIFGVNKSRSKIIYQLLNYPFKVQTKDFNLEESFLSERLKNKVLIGIDLKRSLSLHKKELSQKINLKEYRKKFGLPVHGQRTHSNGKTSKKRIFYA